MRRLFAFDMLSLDGYFEGPGHDLSWHHVDDEFNRFAIAQLNTIGTLIFGRITYEMMASYWPTEAALADDPAVAGLMNELPKVAVSRTLKEARWKNSALIGDNLKDRITALKQQPGKDLALFGSASLLADLLEIEEIDEYRLMINPVVLGGGRPLFAPSKRKLKLNLVRTQVFGNGNVLLCYQPEGK